ncbi:MAG: LLM class flavin-dependent oxidoreductase [Candidatus Heimdallarchaeota archaeon]|nr:LLM class flavin-dependent oxidoreductase [Candidatus Heimdallarchaeota archaeon]MCK4876840.1 LLM class flavin-dependent oxidoreductase [Candidatus Heimdallarchaeota archaeon]
MVSYGLQVEPQFGFDFKQIKEMVQFAEKNKFSHAWFSDHFMVTADSTDVLAYECFTAMMAAVSYTESLRIGSLVFCNNYRHPAVLAKQFASLDHYSEGRVEFGYGAGWKEVEYNQYGIEFPSTGTRLKQMVEGIKVIRNLWTQERGNFQGDYYELKDAVSFPKPFQQPHPPIWVGTMYARPKMLNIAAQYADGINLAWSYTEEVFAEKMQELDELCEKYDRKPSSLRRSYGIWSRIYESEEEKKRVWKEIAEKRGVSLEEVEKRNQGSMHGTIEEITEWLKTYSKLGVEQFIFMFPHNKEIEQMKIMAKEVLPKL